MGWSFSNVVERLRPDPNKPNIFVRAGNSIASSASSAWDSTKKAASSVADWTVKTAAPAVKEAALYVAAVSPVGTVANLAGAEWAEKRQKKVSEAVIGFGKFVASDPKRAAGLALQGTVNSVTSVAGLVGDVVWDVAAKDIVANTAILIKNTAVSAYNMGYAENDPGRLKKSEYFADFGTTSKWLNTNTQIRDIPLLKENAEFARVFDRVQPYGPDGKPNPNAAYERTILYGTQAVGEVASFVVITAATAGVGGAVIAGARGTTMAANTGLKAARAVQVAEEVAVATRAASTVETVATAGRAAEGVAATVEAVGQTATKAGVRAAATEGAEAAAKTAQTSATTAQTSGQTTAALTEGVETAAKSGQVAGQATAQTGTTTASTTQAASTTVQTGTTTASTTQAASTTVQAGTTTASTTTQAASTTTQAGTTTASTTTAAASEGSNSAAYTVKQFHADRIVLQTREAEEKMKAAKEAMDAARAMSSETAAETAARAKAMAQAEKQIAKAEKAMAKVEKDAAHAPALFDVPIAPNPLLQRITGLNFTGLMEGSQSTGRLGTMLNGFQTEYFRASRFLDPRFDGTFGKIAEVAGVGASYGFGVYTDLEQGKAEIEQRKSTLQQGQKGAEDVEDLQYNPNDAAPTATDDPIIDLNIGAEDVEDLQYNPNDAAPTATDDPIIDLNIIDLNAPASGPVPAASPEAAPTPEQQPAPTSNDDVIIDLSANFGEAANSSTQLANAGAASDLTASGGEISLAFANRASGVAQPVILPASMLAADSANAPLFKQTSKLA